MLLVILPDGENKHKHVGEWNLSWSLHKSATALPARGASLKSAMSEADVASTGGRFAAARAHHCAQCRGRWSRLGSVTKNTRYRSVRLGYL